MVVVVARAAVHSADPGRENSPDNPPTFTLRHLRFCRSEQRFRVSLPEDAGSTDARAAQPGQTVYQHKRLVPWQMRHRYSAHSPDHPATPRSPGRRAVVLPAPSAHRRRGSPDDRAVQPERPRLPPLAASTPRRRRAAAVSQHAEPSTCEGSPWPARPPGHGEPSAVPGMGCRRLRAQTGDGPSGHG
jgi:hypothetical protein